MIKEPFRILIKVPQWWHEKGSTVMALKTVQKVPQ